MSIELPELFEPVKAFATALGIGLLIGMERERQPDSAAGLRTFSLVALLGCLFALLDERTGSPWMLAVGLLVVAGAMIASNFSAQQEEQYRGFTTEAAIVITYGLGAAVWLGYATLAVMLAITTTVLLYFKAEIKQFSARTTPRDIISILQFAVLSFIILPILPSTDFGPYNAINPRQIWWMVVLISGLALAGYLALRIIGARHGAAILGIFGGLASSTATTMMYSRHARAHGDLVGMSTIVILIANIMVMIRIGIVASVVAPTLIAPLAGVLACGILPGIALTLHGWRAINSKGDLPMPELKNPTELRIALTFAALYALVLLAAAWLQALAGNSGVFVVALVSGLTDADASTLSTLRMFNLDKLVASDAIIAIVLTLLANLAFKIGLVISIGGTRLARRALPGLITMGIGMSAGLWLF